VDAVDDLSRARRIRQLSEGDLPLVLGIYNHYIKTSTATFEEVELSVAELRARWSKVDRAGLPWLVAEEQSEGGPLVLGYAYARPWHERSAYRFTVEAAVYVAPSHCGHGLGGEMYRALVAALRERAIVTVLAGVALPNPRSEALHRRLGFTRVAHLACVGFKFDQWIDVVYFQLMLNSTDAQPSKSA